jgi:cytochrome c oxidase cbb3-type subunit 4
MDINLIRIAVTVLSFAAFVGIFLWAWSAARRDTFEQAALMPLQEADYDKDKERQ